MTTFTTSHRAVRALVAVVTLGLLFLPGNALAQDTTSTTSTTSTTMASTSGASSLPDLPAVTELPLLGSNITIELGTDENGVLASVTVDGELADFELEQEDGEIEIEFLVSNANGTFRVEVKFEDADMEIEIEGTAVPGDFTHTTEACEGGTVSVEYSVTETGTLVFGSATGDATLIDTESDEIEVRFADGTRIEIEVDDGELSIERDCHEDDDHDSDDGFDDESEDDGDHDDDDDDDSDDDSDDDHDEDDDEDDDE